MQTMHNQIGEWLSGSTSLHNKMSAGPGKPSNDTDEMADYSLTFADLVKWCDPEATQPKPMRARLIVFAYVL